MEFEVRDQQAEKLLSQFSKELREAMPTGYGFSLLIFNLGEDGNMFYASNADREDMVRAMEEFIVKLKPRNDGEHRRAVIKKLGRDVQ